MVKQAQTLNPRRWSRRTLGLVGLPVVIAVLFSAAVVQSSVAATDDLDFVRAERHGVAYLQPLTDLLDRVVEAQTTTVNSGTAEVTALREGMRAVERIDHDHGGELGSGQRWSDLRNRIDGLINQRPTGENAYRSYTEVVQLIQELIRKIADSSNLVLDPVLDSYYLMDTAVIRLSNVTVFAGRSIDLTRLAAAGDQATRGQSDTRVAVARYQVALEGDGIASGLRKAMDITASTTLGPNITNQLDAFRTAVDAFVPPLTLQSLDKVDDVKLVETAGEVRRAARKLTAAVLSELDKMVRARADARSAAQTRSVGLSVLALLLTAALIWTLLASVFRTRVPAAPVARADERSVRSVDREPETGPDPRESLVSEDLVEVGRAIRARRRERADDAR